MKKYILLTFTLLFVYSINAQTARDLFKQKFPELQGALKPVETNKVTKSNIGLFRAQYKKLITAKEEVETFKFGGFDDEFAKIFSSKELKSIQKAGELDALENLLVEEKLKIKTFLSDKHKWGVDSIDCIQKYSNFKMLMKQKDYSGAGAILRELITYYPKSFKGIYSNGDKLMKIMVKNTHNDAAKTGKAAKAANDAGNTDEALKLVDIQKQKLAEKELWIDTLLYITDKRIEHFGGEKNYGRCYLLGKKGGYIYKYRKDTALLEAYNLLKESVECDKENAFFLVQKDYFDASVDLVRSNKIGVDQLVNDYNTSTEYLKKSTEKYSAFVEKERAKSSPKEKKIKNWEKIIANNTKVSDYITNKFASLEYSKCEYLIPAFKEKYDENKSDSEWVEKILGILSSKNCTKDPFFFQAAEELYISKKTPAIAVMLGTEALKKEDYDKAANYFKDAYEKEEDVNKKGTYYYLAAFTASLQHKKSEARKLALKAASLKDGYGKPYILIAKMYAGSSGNCGTSKIGKRAVYWAAVDKLYKAKSVSKDQSTINEANKLIGKYSKRFPNKEELFMEGLYKGNPYKIGCWIGETTTIK